MPDTFRPDVGLLDLIERAHADPLRGPSEIYAYFRRNQQLLGGDIYATYTTFIERVLPARDGVSATLDRPKSGRCSRGSRFDVNCLKEAPSVALAFQKCVLASSSGSVQRFL